LSAPSFRANLNFEGKRKGKKGEKESWSASFWPLFPPCRMDGEGKKRFVPTPAPPPPSKKKEGPKCGQGKKEKGKGKGSSSSLLLSLSDVGRKEGEKLTAGPAGRGQGPCKKERKKDHIRKIAEMKSRLSPPFNVRRSVREEKKYPPRRSWILGRGQRPGGARGEGKKKKTSQTTVNPRCVSPRTEDPRTHRRKRKKKGKRKGPRLPGLFSGRSCPTCDDHLPKKRGKMFRLIAGPTPPPSSSLRVQTVIGKKERERRKRWRVAPALLRCRPPKQTPSPRTPPFYWGGRGGGGGGEGGGKKKRKTSAAVRQKPLFPYVNPIAGHGGKEEEGGEKKGPARTPSSNCPSTTSGFEKKEGKKKKKRSKTRNCLRSLCSTSTTGRGKRGGKRVVPTSTRRPLRTDRPARREEKGGKKKGKNELKPRHRRPPGTGSIL